MLNGAVRRTIIPLVLLAALVIVGGERWHTIASSTRNGVVFKWVQDRWTGDVWIRTHMPDYYEEKPSYHPNPLLRSDPVAVRQMRNRLTTGYYVALGVTALVLALRAKPIARQDAADPNKEAPPV